MIRKIILLSICSFCLFAFSYPAPLQASAITLTSATRSLYAYVYDVELLPQMEPPYYIVKIHEDTATDTSSAYGIYNGHVDAVSGSIAEVQQNTTLNSTDTFLEAYGSMWSDSPYILPGGYNYRSSSMEFTFETTVPTQYILYLGDIFGGTVFDATVKLDGPNGNVFSFSRSSGGNYFGTLDAGIYNFILSGSAVDYGLINAEFNFEVSTPIPTPVPTAALLLGSGLLSLFGIRRKIRQ